MQSKDQTRPIPAAPAEGDGNTDAERFTDFVRKIVAVPKKEIDEKRAEWGRRQAKKKTDKKA